VTLVEMLVTLAILLLMMTAIVKIFQAATGSLSSAQAYQELDNQLRQLDATIRSDLNGVTARLTPPLNPNSNLGYFEYGENEFADVQGEDSDDYIRFTAKAPAGQPFTGRMYLPPLNGLTIANMTALQQQIYLSTQPITITSEYAEIIYFLRNGNLYRRVLLVSPERQSVIWQNNSFAQAAFGGVNINAPVVSWQGMNDISAHPAPRGNPAPPLPLLPSPIVLNTLGNLTNRENRSFYQRFADDFQNLAGGQPPDGLSDDVNGDNVPDYYPTLYPGVLPAAVGGTGPPLNAAGQLIYEPLAASRPALAQVAAFPFVFPGAYSRPQTLGTPPNTSNYGWIHSPEPDVLYNGGPLQFDAQPLGYLGYLQNLNHNPIDVGDNLPLPLSSYPGGLQTWWGFPTWRETLSFIWVDPTLQVNSNPGQPFGLSYQPANVGLGNTSQFLPDMTGTYRNTPQPYNDGPYTNGFFPIGTAQYTLWNLSWEDDLIMTGVRSFDIKAYDNTLAAYADLGWGDDPRVTGNNAIPYLQGNLDAQTKNYNLPAYGLVNNVKVDLINQTFAHEGRMPPLQNDNRLDASYPNPLYTNWTTGNFTPQYSADTTYSSNVGDDNPAIVRLRRVWDSWSTDYSHAPAAGVVPGSGFPWGPPYSPPIYPSYPPPYPAPLRGIQIQIRVADPTNQRIKTLTIRQDFTDKL